MLLPLLSTTIFLLSLTAGFREPRFRAIKEQEVAEFRIEESRAV